MLRINIKVQYQSLFSLREINIKINNRIKCFYGWLLKAIIKKSQYKNRIEIITELKHTNHHKWDSKPNQILKNTI